MSWEIWVSKVTTPSKMCAGLVPQTTESTRRRYGSKGSGALNAAVLSDLTCEISQGTMVLEGRLRTTSWAV